MKPIPHPTLSSAVPLTPLEMNAIHFGGLTSTAPDSDSTTTSSTSAAASDPIR